MAFYNTGLTSITIPSSVNSIGTNAFGGSNDLASVTMLDGITTIGNFAFYNTSITSITIPSSVTNIGDGAFDECKNLKSITIPSNVTSIGMVAFRGCDSLNSITLEKTDGWVLRYGNNRVYPTQETLSNSSTTADYFKNTYLSYTWTRN